MKDVPGHPEYAITEDGRVWSKPRPIPGRRSTPGQWLKPWYAKRGGYPMVSLGRKKKACVHRLVLLTFIGLCPDGMEACHNNGNPADCRLENLRWDTSAANEADKAKHGTANIGEQNGRSKLTDQKARQIIYTHRTELFSQKEIAEQFGISRATVGMIVNRRHWKHIWI